MDLVTVTGLPLCADRMVGERGMSVNLRRTSRGQAFLMSSIYGRKPECQLNAVAGRSSGFDTGTIRLEYFGSGQKQVWIWTTANLHWNLHESGERHEGKILPPGIEQLVQEH